MKSNNLTAQQVQHNPRRQFLKRSGLMLGGSLIGSGLSMSVAADDNHSVAEKHCLSDITYPFYGEHQQGIITPQQTYVYFLVLDLATESLDEVREVFKTWTTYSARLTQGKNVKEYAKNHFVPPADTGEADDLSAYGLTITFGVSPSFLQKLGLQDKAPKELKDLPLFPRDQLKEEFSGGDICIQSCANDAQVAFHAVRQLVRVARSNVTMKWSQAGFISADKPTDTPRNLFGFKDGTANANTVKDLNGQVWIDQPGWLKGGSYLIVRKIVMHLETWDRTSYKEQERTFGRHRISGAPIGEKEEFAPLDLDKLNHHGKPMIPDDSHSALAHKTGKQMLRRAYSYSDGINPRTGQFDSGLLFICYQKDPEQFITIQNALGNVDRLNEYITHIGSGLFACFGGVKEGEFIGQALLGA
ncbi:iron uptake transporter deferrochelatase/peroxidase subunit [Gallibacterium anatis]|uniref:Deferrochelatase n=1 Tax=Gallibacterium anatis TaxID=750 RepID=A0AAX3XC47_9PAST|nr:iron uptake transporter deferrochelatase/peroxidase subunit [Gallibacterium anatis]MDK9431236.1 iron uptake transporter deferrochelatase/peroxidase subunit [Gallibacterium anatis]WIM79622.1 iron uptake transporter deferrochelatase/peroxidase subunit [Gallibacterium anatis]